MQVTRVSNKCYTKLYQHNSNFKRYVDHYASTHSEGRSIPVHEALQHKIVRNVGNAYMDPDGMKIQPFVRG